VLRPARQTGHRALLGYQRNCDPAAEEGGEMQGEAAAGTRILVAEDEFLVALVIEDMLQSLGCTVVGPYSYLAEASEAAIREQVDAAVLDINLHGEMVYPLAEYLHRHGIPFVFATGYAAKDVPEHLRVFEFLRKPVSARTLEQAVRHMLN
jgi:CheY-like chemotaxis protein